MGFYDVRAWLSRFSLSPRSLSVLSGLSTLGLSVSRSLEVRGPFRSSLRRRRFPAFSDVRALVSRSFCGRTLYIWQRSAVFLVLLLSDSRTLGLSRSEDRGPFRSSLRRRRFSAFSDVRALVSRSFCGRTLYIWQRSAVFLVFLLSDSRSLGLSRSEVLLGVLYDVGASRLSQTSALFVSVLSHTDSAYIDRSPRSSGLSFHELGPSRSEVRGL